FNAQTQYQYPETGVGAAIRDLIDRLPLPRLIVPRGPGERAMVARGDSPWARAFAAQSQPANAADRQFVRHMIPHHYQAILMSRLAPQRAADPRLKSLAERIRVEQGVEIDSMRGWQSREGLPV